MKTILSLALVQLGLCSDVFTHLSQLSMPSSVSTVQIALHTSALTDGACPVYQLLSVYYPQAPTHQVLGVDMSKGWIGSKVEAELVSAPDVPMLGPASLFLGILCRHCVQ